MATTVSVKEKLDLPVWSFVSDFPRYVNSEVQDQGTNERFFIVDPRNDESADPWIYYFAYTSGMLFGYNTKTDNHVRFNSATTNADQYTSGVFAPSWGPYGNIGVGSTSKSLVLSSFTLPWGTANAAEIGLNELANRGDGQGYKIRVVSKTLGIVEERYIIGNGRALAAQSYIPTIQLDTPLSFTPANNDQFEILSGSLIFMKNGTHTSGAATDFGMLDIATKQSVARSTTNLPATTSALHMMIATDELMVSYDRKPGEGYFGKMLINSGATTTSLTIANTELAKVSSNMLLNYQIRIVEDTTQPALANVRAAITGHTNNGNGTTTFTFSALAAAPSSTCQVVIEHNRKRVIWESVGSTTIYVYDISANTWSTTSFVAKQNTNGGTGRGFVLAYGLKFDENNSDIGPGLIAILKGNSLAEYELFNIGGSATGKQITGSTVGTLKGGLFTSTEKFASYSQDINTYAGAANKGRYWYVHTYDDASGAVEYSMGRICLCSMKFEPYATPLGYGKSGAAASITPIYRMGNGLSVANFVDGSTKIPLLYAYRYKEPFFFRNVVDI